MRLYKRIPTKIRKTLLLHHLFEVTKPILSPTQEETKKIAEHSFSKWQGFNHSPSLKLWSEVIENHYKGISVKKFHSCNGLQ